MTVEQGDIEAWRGIVWRRKAEDERLPDKIRALQQAIMEDAASEAEQILADAHAQAEAIHAEAEAQANAERETRLQRARQTADGLRGQAVAAAQIEAQNLRLKRREQLLTRVFDEARRQLAEAPQWPDYPDIARRLAREAIEMLRADEVVLHADVVTGRLLDERVLDELGQELGIRLSVGAPLGDGTGVVAETADGHRRYDNTLEARLARMQDTLRAPVYRILAGEAG